jgi:hypothetical protein
MKSSDNFSRIVFLGIVLGIIGGYLYLLLFFLGIGHSYTLNLQHKYVKWVYLDLIIITVGLILFLFLLKKYLDRPTALTRNIMLLHGTYTISVVFILIKKIIHYIIVERIYDSSSYFGILISNFRFAHFFIALSGLFLFEVYLDIFAQTEHLKKGRKQIRIITIIVMLIQLYPYNPNTLTVRVLTSGTVLLQTILIYIPVAIQSYNMIKKSKNPSEFDLELFEGRQLYFSFLFLLLLACSFIGVWLSNVSAIFYDIITETSYGPFYILQNIFIGIVLGNIYFGFVTPTWFKKKLMKLKI